MKAYGRILRLPEVLRRTGMGKTNLYDQMKKGTFPRQIVLSERCVGWEEDTIQQWILDRLEKANGKQSEKRRG